MDLIFCGTPAFAIPTLNALAEAGHNIKLVLSQPDRPSGRGRQVAPTAVKQRATELGAPVLQPEKLKNNDELRATVEKLKPKAIVVVAYGRLIPGWMLALPPLGNINLHASLLPKYRGAAPIQWAIACGESVTGATTMLLNEGLDTGNLLLQNEIAIAPEDTAVTLSPRLAQAGAQLMLETLRQLEAGSIHPRPQEESRATLAPILKKEDGRIDFARSAKEIMDRLRGFQPWPGAYTRYRGKNLEVVWAKVAAPHSSSQPARLHTEQGRLFVGCGQDSELELLELRPEGKKRMTAAEFINGYHPRAGEELGDQRKDVAQP
jgi:methionyl-tRNA formyltransferase